MNLFLKLAKVECDQCKTPYFSTGILQTISDMSKLKLFWVIKTKKAIEEKLAVYNSKVDKEILACNRHSKMLYENLRAMGAGIKRGVNVKMICAYDEKRLKIYREWLHIGVDIRVFNEDEFGPLLPRITVFDGEVARLTIGKPEVRSETDYITLWTESKAFAQMLRIHFMNMWKKCTSIEEYF